MHPRVEFIHTEANGVQSVDGETSKGQEEGFSGRERLALLEGKRGELGGREGHNAASSFEVAGEQASTRIDVSFGESSCVGPRGGTKRRWETRHCYCWRSGTGRLSAG